MEETKQTAANGKPEPRFDSPDGSIDYDALYEDSDEDDCKYEVTPYLRSLFVFTQMVKHENLDEMVSSLNPFI